MEYYFEKNIISPENSLKGEVLKIQRFAINDGNGIRTTVFLKGCPLRCKWCHNPETLDCKPQLVLSHKLCVKCGRCVEACSNGVHSIVGGEHIVNYGDCLGCGRCIDVCPVSALSIKGQSMTVEDVMQVVRKDLDYYRESCGGMTVSGGEPLFQPEFVKGLFKAAHAEGISTTLDSSCFAAPQVFDEILDYADTILFDLKIMDPALHRKYTGVDNGMIHRNFRKAVEHDTNIIVRRIVVPSINDSEEEFASLSGFLKKTGFSGEVNLLPYHRMAIIKYKDIGIKYSLDDILPPEDEKLKKIQLYFLSQGFECKIN